LRFFEIIMAVLIFKLGMNPIGFDKDKYAQAMKSHSDFRKFDDILRMVIDCTADEVHKITQFLELQYSENRIYYGTHESDDCLMTCYVNGLNDGEHIHFIDGGNGGYALAAKQYKAQIVKS
jgi:hypothetical protein